MDRANMPIPNLGIPSNSYFPSSLPQINLGGQTGLASVHPPPLRNENVSSGSTTPLLNEQSPSSIYPDFYPNCDFLSNTGEFRGHFHGPDTYQVRDHSYPPRRPSSLGPSSLGPNGGYLSAPRLSDGLASGAPGIPPNTSPQLVDYLMRLEEDNLRLRLTNASIR